MSENAQITNKETDISVSLIPSKDIKFRHLKEDSQKFRFHRWSYGIELEMCFSSFSPAAVKIISVQLEIDLTPRYLSTDSLNNMQ